MNLRAIAIAYGATVVRPTDTAERRSRIVVAQLYKRYRNARRLRLRIQIERGNEAPATQAAQSMELEAWNSLKAMRGILGR